MNDHGSNPDYERKPLPLRLSGDQFTKEIRYFAQAIEHPGLDWLQLLADYTELLAVVRKPGDDLALLSELTGGSWYLELANTPDALEEIIHSGRLVSACLLLEGLRMPKAKCNADTLLPACETYLAKLSPPNEDFIERVRLQLHNADMLRVQHLLRAIGLLNRAPGDTYQLGLGAGSGIRDLQFVHGTASIDSVPERPNAMAFAAQPTSARHTVLIDNDEKLRKHYQHLTSQASPDVDAFVEDSNVLLPQLGQLFSNRRNMVTAIRFDHRMFPDVSGFLAQLIPCIDDTCDFLVSIGAGFDTDDYTGRINKIDEFFQILEGMGLRPIVLRFHGSGSPAEQRQSLAFGATGVGTFELLYCKLIKKQLSDALA